jgi:hypothetical protein
MTFLDSPSELGRLDVTHLGMWVNVDRARRGDDATFGRLLSRAVGYDVGDDHREYVHAMPEDARAAALGLFTVVAHESRHFHDMLLTPYGSLVTSLNVRQATTMLAALGSLSSQESMIVPITEWAALLPVLRHVDPTLAPPPPNLEGLIDVLAETERALRALDHGIHYPDAPLTSTQILEGSAIWVQLGLAGRLFGIEGSNLLLRAILDSPARTRYFGAIDYVQERLGWLPTAAVQLLLLTALCGDVFSTEENSLRSPVDVLVVLVELMSQHPDFPRPNPTADVRVDEEIDRVHALVQDFCQQAWHEDLEGMIIAASDRTLEIVKEWKRGLEGKDDGSFSFRLLANAIAVYDDFAEVGGRLVANFTMDPVWYFVDRYLDVLPSLPRPVTFLWSDYGFAATPELRETFSVQQELVVPYQDGLERVPGFDALAARAYDDGRALRLALVISPKAGQRVPQEPGMFAFILEDIDVEAWQLYFDSVAPTLRLLTLGPDDGLPGGLMEQPLQVLGLGGTRFYSRAGLLPTPPPFVGAPPP